jgi:3'(2'), 5'-bisphosphate nucleotidase
MNSFENLLIAAINASIIAGEKILSIYNSDIYNIKIKQDNSPITLADSEANNIIVSILEKTGLPIITEENKIISFEIRKNWEYYWLVDPLDGTKEFIKKNGEFTVNIALINKNEPLLGVIYVPVSDVLYFSEAKGKSYKLKNALKINNEIKNDFDNILKNSTQLPLNKLGKKFTIIGSRSHTHFMLEKIISQFKEKFGDIDIMTKGSSLKFCMMAEGIADYYPRYSPTMEWDTAAGHAIAAAAGCTITILDGFTPLKYNKFDLLNPGFMVKSPDFIQ